MSEITTGKVWVDGEGVTHDRLNAMFTGATIDNLAVTTAKLAEAAVTTAKIADNAVTEAKLPTQLDLSGKSDVLLPGAAISGRTAATTIANTDAFLMWVAADGSMKKVTKATLTAILSPAGSVIKTVKAKAAYTSSNVVMTTSSATPAITDGAELMAAPSITLEAAANIVNVTVSIPFLTREPAAGTCVVAVFRKNTSTNAVAAIGATTVLTGPTIGGTGSQSGPVSMQIYDEPGVVGPFVYSVRFGPATGGTSPIVFNDQVETGNNFGHVSQSQIVVQEIKG